MLEHLPTAKGFFQKHHQDVRSFLSDVTLKNFTNLEDDEHRVAFIANIPEVKNFDPLSVISPNVFLWSKKDVEKARELKLNGNSAVQVGIWENALDLYTRSYLFMPVENSDEIAIILANRSAALYHLKHYESALSDIDSALSLGYPKDLRFKILDRKARCYLALKWNKEAIEAFKATVSALDDSKLPKAKSQKMQTDAQLMIEILNKSFDLMNPKQKKIQEGSQKLLAKKDHSSQPVYGKNHSVYQCATNALDIESNESEGRYAKATKDIPVGETVIAEKPFCSVLLSEHSKTHCQHCFKKCIAPIACPTCTNVIFCSDRCKIAALASYHKYECPILQVLWESGCSITCHMALRIISQINISYFIDVKPKLDEKIEGKYQSQDYRRVYDLVRHESIRSKADFLQRTHMAVFLLNLLKTSKYFEYDSLTTNLSYDVDSYIGSLILRNLQILQFNAHEIFELCCDKSNMKNDIVRKDLGKTVFLGGGLYPTLALFNHSCDPGIVRYFQGTSVVVKTIKNIKQGEQISENYGPIFTRKTYTERKAELRDQYWFECHCVACEQKWPVFEDMDESIMRFKCDAGSDCKNVIPISTNCQEFLIKCGLCEQFTNILKGLKALQDTEMIQKFGKDHMAKGEYIKAYSKFLEELKLYDETLAPPFKDYHLCQQNIRLCLLTFGNFTLQM